MNVKNYVNENLLIFDGGMGTYFLKKTTNPMEKCEMANLNQENVILDIHKEYISAGCKAIKTNTFGANRPNFGGDGNLVKTIIEKGYSLATKAAGEAAFVFADMGPIEEDGNGDISAEYKFIADCFIDLGAKNFLFETMSSDNCLAETAKYIKTHVPDAYIIASFAVQPDGYTRDGHLGRNIFMRMSNASEVDAIGLNCVSGPYHTLQYIKELDLKGVTLSVMPNAGYPTVVSNRTIFNSSPEYFAMQMADIVRQGASIIGGCCGTTPQYLKATVETTSKSGNIRDFISIENPKKATVKKVRENFFMRKLETKKVIAVELDPPADADIEKFMNNAKKIKKAGADIITIADCPVGRARMDSSILACKIKRETGIDALPHITCRDRNINATKALLLGLSVEGIDNVLIVTGDPIPSAQRDEVKSVFNFNSRMLASYISNLNETVLTSPFGICGALNVNVTNFNIQLGLAKEKINNGIKVFLTQPIMTEEGFENLKRAKEELNAKILGGIMPIVSHRNACFMNSEISGIKVCSEIIELYKEKTPEECRRLAVEISTAIGEKILPYVDGLYIITPFSKADIVCDIIENLSE